MSQQPDDYSQQILDDGLRALLDDSVWRKSSYSGPHGSCVELTRLTEGRVGVRHSHYPAGVKIVYTRAEFVAFVRAVKDGEFDDMIL